MSGTSLPLHSSHRPAAASTTRRGHSPFGAAAPSITAALLYAVAAGACLVPGDDWVPGRWVPVHLFTLGVLTNLVLVFSEHFGRTLTRRPAASVRWQAPVVNTGIVAMLVGLPTDRTWQLAAGAAVVTGTVMASWWRLRTMRRDAVGARFTWIVRVYERAHGAFVHGAVLGVLIGTGALTGSWGASARVAHLHVNVLGWAGLTLLATLVFFGPTLTRTRMAPGADEEAAGALRFGATGLGLGVLLLLATGVGGPAAVVLRLLAAAGIAALARAATVTCLPVGQVALVGNDTTTRWPVVAVSTWFPVVAWADVAVVATGAWQFLDALGLAMLLGVLGATAWLLVAGLWPLPRNAGEPNALG